MPDKRRAETSAARDDDMARPKKYTAKGLRDGIDRYFDSISRTVTATEPVDNGRRDKYGHVIWDKEPICNDAGDEIRYVEYILPPTITGLCEFLDIHRSTWADYCDAVLHPEFADTTTRTRVRIRAWLEGQLLTRKDVKGIIFDLQNNHGYAEKQEIELGPHARRHMAAANLSVAEKEAMLQELVREFAAGADGDGGDEDEDTLDCHAVIP